MPRWIVRVARDGTVDTGRAVTTDPAGQESTSDIAISLGPDGTGYILHYVEPVSAALPDAYVTIRAFGLDGLRPGWPIQFDRPSVSSPGFGRDGQVRFVQGESDRQGEIDAPSRLASVDRQGRTMWTVELPVAVSPEWTGASAFDVPAPPAAGSRGTAFVATDQHDGERTVVYAVDPSGDVTGRWDSPVGLAYVGSCGGGCDTGCGMNRVVPVVDGADTIYFAPEDGRAMAVGADGCTRAGWPVTLRRTGAAFWSLATDADGTVFALAVEPEPDAYDTPECEWPPASATILAIDPAGSVRARATVVEP